MSLYLSVKKDKEKIIKEYSLDTDDLNMVVSDANRGVYATSFFDFTYATGHSKDTVANILNISVKTLTRYEKDRTKMNPQNSEHLIKLFALYRKGIDVFSNIAFFNNWLQKPSYGLGNNIPFNYLNTISGINLILEELTKIEFGDLA